MELTNQNILVTGGAGFIGRFLVDSLISKNRVKVVDNLSRGEWDPNMFHGVDNPPEFIKGDITRMNDLEAIFDGVDVVFHLAVKSLRDSLGDPQGAHRVNVIGTRYVCDASQRTKVKKFIYISTSDVYGNVERYPTDEECIPKPVNPYGITKLDGEKVALSFFEEHGLKLTVIRVFNSYGPRCHYKGSSGEVIPRLIVRALQGISLPVFGDGSQTRSFTYISDVIEGIHLVSKSEELNGRVINIGVGKEYSLREIGRIIMDQIGGDSVGFQFYPERPSDVRRQWADITLARRLLRFNPRVTIEEGIANVIEWIKSLDLDWNLLLQSDPVFNWKL